MKLFAGSLIPKGSHKRIIGGKVVPCHDCSNQMVRFATNSVTATSVGRCISPNCDGKAKSAAPRPFSSAGTTSQKCRTSRAHSLFTTAASSAPNHLPTTRPVTSVEPKVKPYVSVCLQKFVCPTLLWDLLRKRRLFLTRKLTRYWNLNWGCYSSLDYRRGIQILTQLSSALLCWSVLQVPVLRCEPRVRWNTSVPSHTSRPQQPMRFSDWKHP